MTDVPRLAESLERQVRHFAQLALAHAGAPDAALAIRAGMREAWLAQAREHGCRLDEARVDALLRGDLDLNVDGVLAWLGAPTARAPRLTVARRVAARFDATSLMRPPRHCHEDDR